MTSVLCGDPPLSTQFRFVVVCSVVYDFFFLLVQVIPIKVDTLLHFLIVVDDKDTNTNTNPNTNNDGDDDNKTNNNKKMKQSVNFDRNYLNK